jgi:hypothetical protein
MTISLCVNSFGAHLAFTSRCERTAFGTNIRGYTTFLDYLSLNFPFLIFVQLS